MTALETFTTASKQPLTTGRRPDMTAICVRREKAALSSGCKSHPANAPPEATGAVMEVTKWLKPSV